MVSKKRLKEIDTIVHNLENIRKDLYPNEEAIQKYSGGLDLSTGLGIDH